MASSNIRRPDKASLEKEVEKLAKLLEVTTLQFKTVQQLLAETKADVEPDPVPVPSGNSAASRRSTRTRRVVENRRQQCPPTPARNGGTQIHGLWKTRSIRGKKAVWFCHCKEKFHSYKSLRNHFVMKTQPKRLQCQNAECRKMFHLGEQLKRHCKEKHGQVVFSCSICYTQFEDGRLYKRHVATSLFDDDCAARLKEKRRKREPIFSPLREGACGYYSVREQPDEDLFDINEFL